jgi:tRNA (guanine-N7-)-methyltransferase
LISLSKGLQTYSIPWKQLDWPLDLESLFGFGGPLDVEIGFGNGAFLADLAAASPERQFIGIERSLGSLTRLFSRLVSNEVQNVRVIQADASFILDRLFGPEDISGLFMNFPDPWPKERHHPRRLIQPAFIRLVARRLVPDGELMIGTDHEDYARWITEVLEGQSDLASKHPTTFVSNIPGRKPTKYEQKAREIGSQIHFFQWKRAKSIQEARKEERVDEMPNVLLEGPFDPDALLSNLATRVWKFDNEGIVVVKTRNIYREQPSGHLLIEIMVREDAFSQHFGVSAIPRPPNRVLVKLSPIGYPRPTWAVKQAVKLVSELIVKETGIQVVSSNLPETCTHHRVAICTER